MTDLISGKSHTAATARQAGVKKPWAEPTLSRIDSNQAENSPFPAAGDATITLGS